MVLVIGDINATTTPVAVSVSISVEQFINTTPIEFEFECNFLSPFGEANTLSSGDAVGTQTVLITVLITSGAVVMTIAESDDIASDVAVVHASPVCDVRTALVTVVVTPVSDSISISVEHDVTITKGSGGCTQTPLITVFITPVFVSVAVAIAVAHASKVANAVTFAVAVAFANLVPVEVAVADALTVSVDIATASDVAVAATSTVAVDSAVAISVAFAIAIDTP